MSLVASFAPSLHLGANDATRATNKLYALQSHVIVLFTWSNRSVYGLSRSPFVQISSIYRKTTAGFEEMEHEFPFAIFRPKKQDNFSDVPLLSAIFRWDDPKRRVPLSFQPHFPETFCKW